MGITKELYGRTPDGRDVYAFRLVRGDVQARILSLGCIIAELIAPDRSGRLADVSLGAPDLSHYLAPHPYFGAIIGRCANRIQDAAFVLNGKTYALAANDKGNALHGGVTGFDKVLWDADTDGEVLRLTYVSADGEEGYPGQLTAVVEYSIDDSNGLAVHYHAETDADTLCNLTNHSYFNIAGHDSGSVLGHELCIHADRFAHVGENSLPDGTLPPVAGTPLDFTRAIPVGTHLSDPDDQLLRVGGFDHNFILDTQAGTLVSAALYRDPASGRSMEVLTDCPTIQLYSGNWLDGSTLGKSGCRYQKHGGLLLAPQLYPNAPAHPEFPSVVLRRGEAYDTRTVYRFHW